MYTLEFYTETFSGNLAGMEEKFFKVGRSRVRIQPLEGGWSSALETRSWFRAKSRDPFLIVIVRKAGGQDAHLDGQIRILAPQGCQIHGEGKLIDAVTGEETAYIFSAPVAEL